MIEKIQCTVKKTFQYYGQPFYKNDYIIFWIDNNKIENRSGKYSLKINEKVSVYDLYVRWKEDKFI